MPISISDRKLAALYTSLEKQKAANPNFKIGDTQVLQLLAEVGDRWGSNSAKVLQQLKAPGLTRDQQVALVQKGMSASEKADLAAIVDKGDVPLEASAKAFINSVLGRTGPNPPPPPPNGDGNLHVVGDQHAGIAGTAKAGDSIEAINLTTAPGGRLHLDDTMVIGKADNTGKFSGLKLPDMQEGDVIRMRARHADGTAGDWVTFNVKGEAAADTRNAVVAMFRIGLVANGDKVAVSNINDGRQISEPNAQLQFTNTRTGEKQLITLDKDGTFAPNTSLNGKAGDVFSIAASDGTNNKNFATEIGRLTVPGGDPNNVDLIKDPQLHKDELNPDGSPKFEKHRFTGPLFKGTPTPEEVRQGQLGDCYFPSAAAAMAKNHPEVIQNMMKDNGDGTYTVTWKQKDWSTGQWKNVPVKVDGDLYVRSWGGPLYGTTNSADQGEKTMELWFPLLEKSYAQMHPGGYNDIGNGGQSSDVFAAMMGRDADYTNIGPSDTDLAWQKITTKIDAKLPVSAGTYGDDQQALYTNTGVYADHSYSVLGYEQSNGQKYVILRNPWGESEPAGNGPNDGIFKLDIKTFCKLYQSVMSVD